MNDSIFLSRRSFDKGLNDTLTLKPLRSLAKAIIHNKRPTPEPVKPPHSTHIVVSKDSDTGAWRVRKAS